jgi:PAS domain-containing protein
MRMTGTRELLMAISGDAHHGNERSGKRLIQMEERYFGLLEAAPDAIAVVDQSGLIVLLNLRAETQFGYPRDELLGRPVTTIIPKGFAERLVADSLRRRPLPVLW